MQCLEVKTFHVFRFLCATKYYMVVWGGNLFGQVFVLERVVETLLQVTQESELVTQETVHVTLAHSETHAAFNNKCRYN